MPSVLITGAARGIGRTTALRLAAAGWDVIAGVRDPAHGTDLAASAAPGRITPVVLDITDPEHIAALTGALPARLDALVNNAGIVVGGPIEGLALDDLRRQLEVNVTAQVAVTQAALPALRTARGRIVFVSSVSGRVATPLTGAYNASKFALEGLADALRLEIAPWGIKVAIVEPAQTATDLWDHAERELDATVAALTPEHRALYGRHLDGYRRAIPRSQKMAGPADAVAAAIEKALTARRPRARYVVGAGPKVQMLFAHLLPTPVLDTALRTAVGVPRKL